ncbi:hypothetical protein KSP39_PZI008839 [Platanthera zijinensis]|uniref:Putative plant transposon protein domain-containing protein n=1 Tax=Platanthera zijinensis TaxID=2320716 RepID=A0AAP0BLM2_9ASPA
MKYVNQIRALQWESFCHPRTEAILSWVYEFYANARDSNGEKVFVRGKSVEFSAKVINDLFDLDDTTQDGYANILSSVSIEEMMAVVCCTPESEWASQSRKTLRATCLNREAKVWLLFINAGVMPTRHLNTLTIDKVALIYSILKGIKLNMGELISTLIKQKF